MLRCVWLSAGLLTKSWINFHKILGNGRLWNTYARFYELGLTRELTNPRVGVIPSLFSD